jgi:hydrogenase maturation protease
LDPAKVLVLAKSMGARFKRILLVGCEPLTLSGDEGIMGLSDVVQAAVNPAVDTIRALVQEFENTEEIVVYAKAGEGY